MIKCHKKVKNQMKNMSQNDMKMKNLNNTED